MAGENDGAQTNTEAPGSSTQPVEAPVQAGGTTLLTDAGGKPEGDTKATDNAGGDGNNPDANAGDEGDGKAGADKPEIEYGEFALPEGIVLDEQALGRFTPIAKELGLNQDQAQKFVSLYAEMQAESQQQFADQVAQWGEQARNDPEMGGAKFDESLAVAVTGLKAFASPELIDLLNSTGLGNHPEMIRFCRRVGMALGEDKTVAPGNGAGRQLSLEERLYPNHKP